MKKRKEMFKIDDIDTFCTITKSQTKHELALSPMFVATVMPHSHFFANWYCYVWRYYGQSKGDHSLWCELAPGLIMKIATSGNFSVYYILTELWFMELKQPWRRRRQGRHKYPYLTIKNFIYACIAHFSYLNISFALLVLSMAWNQLFCICMEDVSALDKFSILSSSLWLQFNFRILRTLFVSKWLREMIAETRSCLFRWGSRCRRRHLFLTILNYNVGVSRDLDQQVKSNWDLKNKTGYMESREKEF